MAASMKEDPESAAKAHESAATMHERAATTCRMADNESQAVGHDAAAALHRKAASLQRASMAVRNAVRRPREEENDDDDNDADDTQPAGLGGSVQAGNLDDYDNEEAERSKNPARNQADLLPDTRIDYRTGEIITNWGEGSTDAYKSGRERGDRSTGRQLTGGVPGVDEWYNDFDQRQEDHGPTGAPISDTDMDDLDQRQAQRLMGGSMAERPSDDILPLPSTVATPETDLERRTGSDRLGSRARTTKQSRGKGTDEAYGDDDGDDTALYDQAGYVGKGRGKPPTQNVYYASDECLLSEDVQH
jgi:hypothetical protein